MQYGARGSACRSSPSSHTTTRPRSATGAQAAARVPTATRTRPAPHGQPAPVALGRAEVGREDDVGHVAERGGDPGDVARVGQHHHRPPATGGAGGDGGRDLGRPARPGQRGPDGPRRTPLGEGLQQRGTGRVALPAAGQRRRGRRGGLPGRLGLDAGVPRGQGQAQDVVQRPGPAVGDRPRQRRDLVGQHRLGADQAWRAARAPGRCRSSRPGRARRRRPAGRRTGRGRGSPAGRSRRGRPARRSRRAGRGGRPRCRRRPGRPAGGRRRAGARRGPGERDRRGARPGRAACGSGVAPRAVGGDGRRARRRRARRAPGPGRRCVEARAHEPDGPVPTGGTGMARTGHVRHRVLGTLAR